MIYPTVSNITRSAYDPKRLRLKKVDENHLARICQDISDNILSYSRSPANRALGDATSPSSNDSDSNGGCLETDDSN